MNTTASDYTEEAKSRVSETMQNMQQKAAEKAKAASEATDRYVRENPWRMIAVVALGACVLGYLLGSLRD